MTTTLAIVLVVMLVVAAVGLAIPLVRRYDAAAREGETIAAVIRGQLDEVDAQAASGQIGSDAAAALRTELKRRLLVEARARPVAVRLLSDRAGARLALLVATAVALAAAGLYAVGGRPDLATSGEVAAEVAAATGTAPAPDNGIGDLIRPLEARAAASPDDATGWRTLAMAYFEEQRFADAAAAYARAVKLRPRDAALLSAQGEALTQAAGGIVTPAAAQAFTAAHGLDATDARARYFLALARDQHGDHKGAIDGWVALLNDGPADAPWAAQLRGFVEQAAKQAGISLAGRLKAPLPVLAGAANARGPDAAAVAAAGGMSDDARAAFIKGMVDNLAAKLAANPRDADGWIRLIRARKVMGDAAAAKAALAKGEAAFADDPATAKSISDAAAAMGVG
jgi:cytochrome c-type biogenesis protein CcmH